MGPVCPHVDKPHLAQLHPQPLVLLHVLPRAGPNSCQHTQGTTQAHSPVAMDQRAGRALQAPREA